MIATWRKEHLTMR